MLATFHKEQAMPDAEIYSFTPAFDREEGGGP